MPWSTENDTILVFQDGGWRVATPSEIVQLLRSLSARAEKAEMDVSKVLHALGANR